MQTKIIHNRTFVLYDLDFSITNIENTHLQYSGMEHNLNSYGKGPFCKFTVNANSPVLGKKGCYGFLVDGIVKYVGKTTDSFLARINNGYGNISPRNCYEGGQSTNCKVNSNINKALQNNKDVKIGFLELNNDQEISRTEEEIIAAIQPEWNAR